MMQKIAIGADHAGFEYKELLKKWLEKNGYSVKDFGTYTTESADYPDFAHPVANSVEKNEFDLGVLVCGSANGVAITANKHQGVRAALCWNEELASLARQHNNANVLCLPSRFVDVALAEKILDRFLHSSFEGGRHERRVNKIGC
ncbi:MAG TPA: ribose 5-phosphate isomerase B [Cyclobacteriaceae bacterium]|nr:ribose 5-phosphate isomerase B [Cyclobacteriaceae bacterium]